MTVSQSLAPCGTAVLDANVLAPLVKRRVMLTLSQLGLYCAVFTPRLLDEARHAQGRFSHGRAERYRSEVATLQNTDMCAPDPADLPEISLPDRDDLHVLAAAVEYGASVIVTENIRDFPRRHLTPLGVEVLPPDRFAERAIAMGHLPLADIYTRLSTALDDQDTEDLLALLQRGGLKRTVRLLSPPSETAVTSNRR